MSTRRELISQALLSRFSELCGERIGRVAPETFGEMASFVTFTRGQLLNASVSDLKTLTPDGNAASAGWMISEGDCLSSLRALSLGELSAPQPGERPPPDSFLKSFIASRKDPARRFQLLAERYRWPQNFSLAAEDEARELVLTSLMAHDRTLFEKTPFRAVQCSDLWLRLNLVALHAARVPDLRFLDALNYYYELLYFERWPQTERDWLLISYFAFYARALAAWI